MGIRAGPFAVFSGFASPITARSNLIIDQERQRHGTTLLKACATAGKNRLSLSNRSHNL